MTPAARWSCRRRTAVLLAALLVAGAWSTDASAGTEPAGAAPSAAVASAEPEAHPYGVLSILPPIVAIGLAIATGRVVPSLLLGVVSGALITSGWHPWQAIRSTILVHLWNSFADTDHAAVFGFTLLMGAMVGVVNRSGGMHGLVDKLAPLARNRRRGQLTTWLLGLVIFFDDYANSLLLGGTMRPLTDRLRISREKLAYLVDSTAAPVAGLAVVSTWVAGEVSYIQEGLDNVGLTGTGYEAFGIFLATIPYRFYVILSLVFVLAIGWFDRDFGPMLAAERRAARGRPRERSFDDALGDDILAPDADTPRRWSLAVVPIVVTVAGVFWLLVETGRDAIGADAPLTLMAVSRVLGNSNSYLALFFGSLAGLLVAVVMVRRGNVLSPFRTAAAATAGAQMMVPALVILWLAWSLSAITGPEFLATGDYLAGLLGAGLDVAWLPTITFVLASAVAFSTGTSWGTMGILMPLVIQVAYELLTASGGTVAPDDRIMLGTMGGVLAGSIFGDHCSPISDTTVLSSRASGCDHVAHVWTQLPYAVVVALVAIFFGTLPVGFGVPVWPLLPVGTAVLVAIVLLVGKPSAGEAAD